jgi:hypothetical protein
MTESDEDSFDRILNDSDEEKDEEVVEEEEETEFHSEDDDEDVDEKKFENAESEALYFRKKYKVRN